EAVYAGRPRHPIGVALADTAERFAIPREHFEAVIAGVEMDLRRNRYETWEDELAEYCYRVAGAVGLVCIQVFGYRNPSARQYAVELGLAFQLTNILRDVAEDAQRGRIYLPRADLRRFGCREEDVLVGHCTEAFRQVMAFECARAGEHYGRARFLLAEEDRQSLAPAEAMRLIYEQLLRRLMFRHYPVFASPSPTRSWASGRLRRPRYPGRSRRRWRCSAISCSPAATACGSSPARSGWRRGGGGSRAVPWPRHSPTSGSRPRPACASGIRSRSRPSTSRPRRRPPRRSPPCSAVPSSRARAPRASRSPPCRSRSCTRA